jgi:hypothetical protein
MIDYDELHREMVNTPPVGPRHCFIYVAGPTSDGKDHVYELRGRRYFELLQEQYEIWAKAEVVAGVEVVGHTPRVLIGNSTQMPPCPNEIMFQVMPCPPTDEGVSLYEEYVETATLISDVTADVFKIGEWGDDGAGGKAGKTVPMANWEWWYRDEVQNRFLRILKLSAVITTSWAELVRPLEILTNRPVIHLPDWHDEDEGPFWETWTDHVMREVVRQQCILHPEHFKLVRQSRWKRFVNWFLVREAKR